MRFWVLAAVILLAYPAAGLCEEVSKIIVKVNNQVITSRDLDEYCKALAYRFLDSGREPLAENEQFRDDALNRLIEDTLILDKARQEGVEIPAFRVEDKVEQLVFSYPSRDEFENSLIEKGLTITLLRKKIEEQFMLRDIIDKYVRSRISVSPREIAEYYSQHPEEFYSPVRYIFHIAKSADSSVLKKISAAIVEEGVLKAQVQYKDALIKLESDQGELRPEISEIIKGLSVGEQQIKRVGDIFYLIFLDQKILPRPLDLDETKEEIYAYLWDLKFRERFSQWVNELKEDAVIKSYL